MTANRVPAELVGKTIRFRAATAADAAFILSLRLDPAKNRYLTPTDADLAAQVAWIEKMAARPDHRYFIIETIGGEPVGTLRLMVEPDDMFAAHSMILGDNAPPGASDQVAVIVYRFALVHGLRGGRFETRRENSRAIRYFERVGATLVATDETDCHFAVSTESMRRFLAAAADGDSRSDPGNRA